MTSNYFNTPSKLHTNTYNEEMWYQPKVATSIGKLETPVFDSGTLSWDISMNPNLSKYYKILCRSGLSKIFGIGSNISRTLFVPNDVTLKDMDVEHMTTYDCIQFIYDRMINKKIMLSQKNARYLKFQGEGEFAKEFEIIQGDQSYFFNMFEIHKIDIVTKNGIYNIY